MKKCCFAVGMEWVNPVTDTFESVKTATKNPFLKIIKKKLNFQTLSDMT